jgi:hypothetical protein
MTLKKPLFSIIFFGFFIFTLFTPSYLWFVIGKNDRGISELENRYLQTFPDEFQNFKTALNSLFQGLIIEAGEYFFSDVINGSFQDNVEIAMSDQFPARELLIRLSNQWQYLNTAMAYSLVQDELIPPNFDDDYLVTRDYRYILRRPANWAEETKESLQNGLKYYQDMKEAFPEINFNLLMLNPLSRSQFHPSNMFFPEADAGRSAAYIKNNPPFGWNLAILSFDSYEEYKENFFRTDHHLNIRGGWKLYQKSYELLSESFTDISPMLELKEIKKVEGIKMLGSSARGTLIDKYPEDFEYSVVDLEPYDVLVNKEFARYGSRDKYLNGIFPKKKFTDHYRIFYGSAQKLIQYSFPSSQDRNILIFSDSYSRIIQNYIASHYRKTLLIDFRFIESLDMTLSEIIKVYEIDDVLFVGSTSSLFFDLEKISF